MSKPHIRIVTARIEREGRYLITQRNPHAVLPLLWEFPGGRVEDGESDEDALRRELSDKIGIEAKVGALSLSVTHEYERYHLEMCVYHTTTEDTPQAVYVNDVQWVHPDAFGDYKFPGADQQTVDALLGE